MSAKLLKLVADNDTTRAIGHERMRAALAAVADPLAVVVIAIGHDGSFAIRTAQNPNMRDFDLYARAGAILDREKMKCID